MFIDFTVDVKRGWDTFFDVFWNYTNRTSFFYGTKIVEFKMRLSVERAFKML